MVNLCDRVFFIRGAAFDHGRQKWAALASSASIPRLDHYRDLLDAHHLVAISTSGDDVKATKPALEIFATARSDLVGIRADEGIAIGDIGSV